MGKLGMNASKFAMENLQWVHRKHARVERGFFFLPQKPGLHSNEDQVSNDVMQMDRDSLELDFSRVREPMKGRFPRNQDDAHPTIPQLQQILFEPLTINISWLGVEENVEQIFGDVIYWLRVLKSRSKMRSLDVDFCAECRQGRKCMKDSILTNFMFLAMDKIHEKLKSRQGVIGQLIEILKFCELAVMQLDGCLRIMEEATDNLSLEVNHEEIMSDLYLIRDRLQRRLDDTELTIMNTDSCLAERFENELKLREALEMKEKELVSLRGDLDQLERLKRNGHQEMQKIRSNQASRVNNGKEEDISVDGSQMEQLGSDIDKLKESLDRAFAKMQNAIFLSKVEPAEHEWRCSIEKDVLLISAKGLTEDFHVIHEPTVRKLNYFSLLMNEITSLRTELEQLMREQETSVNPSSSQTDTRVKIPPGTKEKPPLDGKKEKHDERTKAEQADNIEEEGGNYVAKLISTHERIIQKAIEEQRAKERLMRERWYSAMRKDKQSDGLNKKIQDVIATLDGIINLNPQPKKSSVDLHEDSVKPMTLRRFSSESELEIRNMSSSMFCQVDEDLLGQVRILEREKEDSRMQSWILQQVHAALMRAWMKQCYDEFDRRIEQLLNEVRMLEREAENSKTKSIMLEDACRKLENKNEELYRNVKILEQVNEDSEGQSHILEETYAVLLTVLTKEHKEELQKMSASTDLLEEIVYEFTKML